MKKNHKIILVVSIVILIITLVLILVFRKPKPAVNTNAPTAAPVNGGSSTAGPPAEIITDNFPIDIGSKGSNVKALQMALNTLSTPLGKTPLTTDGVMGNLTRDRLLTTVEVQLSMLPMSAGNFATIVNRANGMAANSNNTSNTDSWYSFLIH